MHVPRTEYQERITEVPRIEYRDRIIEVPEIHYEDKVIEVPQVVYQEQVRHVPRLEIHERYVTAVFAKFGQTAYGFASCVCVEVSHFSRQDLRCFPCCSSKISVCSFI